MWQLQNTPEEDTDPEPKVMTGVKVVMVAGVFIFYIELILLEQL